MKREEKSALKFLRNRFGKEPTYEPLGKDTTPDFSIGGTAFEVRRLNQRFFRADGSNEGLEQIDIRLSVAVRRELGKIEFLDEAGSFWWGLKFRRPLAGRVRDIARQLAREALRHYAEGSRERREITVGSVTLDLMPADEPKGRAFVAGFRVDRDSGGFLGEIYPASILAALQEKIAQTAKVAGLFNHWALILVDFIFGDMVDMVTQNDIGRMNFDLEHFDSVAVIGPDGTLTLEWPENSLRACES
jgi:hypothetical protein